MGKLSKQMTGEECADSLILGPADDANEQFGVSVRELLFLAGAEIRQKIGRVHWTPGYLFVPWDTEPCSWRWKIR